MTTTPTWCIENQGSFASIHVILPSRTQIHCETDAVVTFSSGVEIQGVLSGGLLPSLFRVFFGNESFFTTLVENPTSSVKDVMLAAADPGSMVLHQLSEHSELSTRAYNNDDLLLTSGAYVASDVGVNITTELQSRIKNSLLSGTGFFLLRASGRGTVACSAYGSIHKFELKAGEQRSVDNGHLVAWSASMNYRVGLANARGGILTSMKSGEGLMCHFVGPGIIYLQSHKPGEAKTVIKQGKSGARAALKTGMTAYACIFLLYFFIFVIVLVVIIIGTKSGNMQFYMTSNNNAYGEGYDNYGYSSGRRNHRSSSRGYQAVGEL